MIRTKEQIEKDIEICKAVRASCSFPGIFEPVKWNGTAWIATTANDLNNVTNGLEDVVNSVKESFSYFKD